MDCCLIRLRSYRLVLRLYQRMLAPLFAPPVLPSPPPFLLPPMIAKIRFFLFVNYFASAFAFGRNDCFNLFDLNKYSSLEKSTLYDLTASLITQGKGKKNPLLCFVFVLAA